MRLGKLCTRDLHALDGLGEAISLDEDQAAKLLCAEGLGVA